MSDKRNWFDRANLLIRETEASVLNFVSLITPWLVSSLPSYMTFTNLQSHLNFPFVWALIGGIVVEALGLTTLHTTVQFWFHNRKHAPAELETDANSQAKAAYRRKMARLMPTQVAVITYLFYVSAVLLLNVMLDWQVLSWVEVLTRGILALLSVPAGLMLATRTLYTETLLDMEREKESRNIPRAEIPVKAEKRKVSGNSAGYKMWGEIPADVVVKMASMTPAEIVNYMADTGVSQESRLRTARNWAQKAREVAGNG